MVDDWQPEHKKLGITCLQFLIDNVNAAELKMQAVFCGMTIQQAQQKLIEMTNLDFNWAS